MATAHAYARISTPEQTGLQRQTAENQDKLEWFCRQHKFTLNPQIMVDDGVSAFQGLNLLPQHELGKFMDRAKRGLVPPGDCILVENIDRLSRQGEKACIRLMFDLHDLQIHIGVLGMDLLRWDSTNAAADIIRVVIEAGRGNSESKVKQMRSLAGWKRRRQNTRDTGATYSGKQPAWIQLVDGVRTLIPEKAALVKHIYQLAGAGHGHRSILKTLAAEGVPPMSRSYIELLLQDKRVLGEYQMCSKGRKPDGAPIAGYFPAVVTMEEWSAARAGAEQRKIHRGGSANYVNLFSGLVQNTSGETYYVQTRIDRGKATRVLQNSGSADGRSKCCSFPLRTFERAVLRLLREIPIASVLNGDSGTDKVQALNHRLVALEAEIKAIGSDLEAYGFSALLGERVRKLEAQKVEVEAALAVERQRAAHPLSASWDETKSLLAVVDGADRNTLLRLQARMRDVVEKFVLYVLPVGKVRWAIVEAHFVGGTRRMWLVCHIPSWRNQHGSSKPGKWFAFSDVHTTGDITLVETQERFAVLIREEYQDCKDLDVEQTENLITEVIN